MLQFEDLTIDYIDHLPLLTKFIHERQFPFFIERFGYAQSIQTLYLPKKPKCESLRWIASSINHEFLHHILNMLENKETSMLFDVFEYEDLVSGNIEKETLGTT
jgi:hypothetical protein